jgi:hypothetical protein
MKDGDIRSFDDGRESGLIIFHGKPRDFINLYFIAFKDKQDTREFAEKLKNSFLAQGIGIVAEQALTIFAGPTGTMAYLEIHEVSYNTDQLVENQPPRKDLQK